MISLSKIICLIAVLGLTACANSNRYLSGDNSSGLNGSADGLNDGTNVAPGTPGDFAQTIGDRVFFAVDAATLSDAARGTLAAQAVWLIDNQEYNITIEGHADEQGTRVYNFNLGEKRANAVREYMISRGVLAARLQTISYGKERPVELCSQEICYSKNRRAVTVLNVLAGG